MAGTGRNDPCPCGSGKKYKNCCLNKDRARRIRDSAWRGEEQVTLQKLLAFVQRPAFNPQTVVASNLFWNGNYGAEGLNALDSDEMGRFLDWYMLDFRLEENRKRPVDLFLEEMGTTLLPGQRELVQAWRDSHLSLYRIVAPAHLGILSVLDVFQETPEKVDDHGLGRLALVGDLILGRILPSSPPHFSWAAIVLPADVEAEFISFVRNAHRQYQEMHLEASWADFLSTSGYLLNHCLLRLALQAGKPRATGAPYYDGAKTVQGLAEVEKRVRERAAKEAKERRKSEQRPSQPEEEALRQTRGGILLPGHVKYRGSKELKP